MARQSSVVGPDDPAWAGQASYTPRLLRSYDTLVVSISNRFVWRCPSDVMLAQYDRHVGPHHVDVGPGSGWFLDHMRAPSLQRLTVVDANPNVLDHVAQRVARHTPITIEANVVEPIEGVPEADSVGCNFVLHCLPGDMTDKARVVGHLVALLREGGTLFGSTILGESGAHSMVGRVLLGAYNRKGLFGNAEDTLAGLRAALDEHCTDVAIDVHGTVALFSGRRPAA